MAGADVAVMGCGPIGLMTAMVARHRGAARVTLIDIAEQPLTVAAGIGFATLRLSGPVDDDYNGRFDVIFEASGAGSALVNALAMVRRGGTIVQIGNFAVPELTLPSNIIMSKEITWRGSFRFGNVFQEAVALIVDREIDLAPIISASLPLSSATAAFELAMDRTRSMKVVLTN